MGPLEDSTSSGCGKSAELFVQPQLVTHSLDPKGTSDAKRYELMAHMSQRDPEDGKGSNSKYGFILTMIKIINNLFHQL
jgi:hypothetical protein